MPHHHTTHTVDNQLAVTIVRWNLSFAISVCVIPIKNWNLKSLKGTRMKSSQVMCLHYIPKRICIIKMKMTSEKSSEKAHTLTQSLSSAWRALHKWHHFLMRFSSSICSCASTISLFSHSLVFCSQDNKTWQKSISVCCIQMTGFLIGFAPNHWLDIFHI